MMKVPNQCEWWSPEKDVSLLEGQRACLEEFRKAGLSPFTGPAFLIGAMSSTRCALIIHRGSGRRWELVLAKDEEEVEARLINDLDATKNAAIKWLRGDNIKDV